jgi:hypothetical protein
MVGGMDTTSTNGRNSYSLPGWLIATAVTSALGIATGSLGTLNSHSGRIAVLESIVASHHEQLDRIEHKLDRLLEQKAHKE